MTSDLSNWTMWLAMTAAVLAITGVVLNNRRMIACFSLWIISNSIVCGLHCYAGYHGASGMWPLAARDAVFFALAIEGWVRWRRKR